MVQLLLALTVLFYLQYFKAHINFSNVPGKSYSGQLDCTCDQMGIGVGRDKNVRTLLLALLVLSVQLLLVLLLLTLVLSQGLPPGVPSSLDLMLNTSRGALNWTGPKLPPPAWVANLSLYEINPRGFTSPAGAGANGTCWENAGGDKTKGGCGSGTWKSLAQRGIPHLKKLGITGLWIAGSGLSDAHFFGIWSTYATIDPSKLDPVLGPEADFKVMVDAAHAAGIKVFLDVTTHGLVDASPLIAQHPHWFVLLLLLLLMLLSLLLVLIALLTPGSWVGNGL